MQCQRPDQCLRFTPAHAGNTLPHHPGQTEAQVHPRSRGEYSQSPYTSHDLRGSPPLTRGILKVTQSIYEIKRFTPAHAGNTWKYKNIRRSNQVHPRSRGEYRVPGLILSSDPGSPPLTRGIRGYSFDIRSIGWFTPAHAGNTLRCPSQKKRTQVHPRSRGEYPPRL